ncbi:MAG: endonuclease MutS2 [Bacillota bacterium]
MNPKTLTTLEYDKIKVMLAETAQSNLGRELVDRLRPLTQRAAVEAALQETTEARAILERGAQVPSQGLSDIRDLAGKAERGGVIAPVDLLRVADCLRGCRELKRYMEGKRLVAPTLSRYAEAIVSFKALEDEIYQCVEGSRVASAASPKLSKVRREIQLAEERIQSKLQSFLAAAGNRDVLQESFVSVKGGHYALPVKAGQRHKVQGVVVDTSGSGMTVFIEPAAVRKLADELAVLRGVEEAEEYQVLVTLSGLVGAEARAILADLEVMAAYDFAFAKGRLSLAMRARPVDVNDEGFIQISGARHPLIREGAVPLDLVIGRRYRTLVITGPNTGGKTVALKTVGLLTLMAQSGLHVPAGEGTDLAVFEGVLADIGDAQSIEQSLSTFSSHIGQIAGVLREAGRSTLVLLDEVGTGTDPAEGAALAMAILEQLHEAGAVTLATTHYGDVKRLADLNSGFINGRMDFDRETLGPLYRLVMGEAGSSNAFWIAERLGIGPGVLARAREHLGARAESEAGAAAAELGATATDGQSAGESRARKEPEKPVVRVKSDPAPVVAETASAPRPDGDGRPKPRQWQVGDSVILQTIGQRGVVAELPNEKGEMVIFTRGKRVTVNHKRVTLLVAAEHLYPEDYDMRVALYSWPERKLMKDMGRKHVDGQRVIVEGKPE